MEKRGYIDANGCWILRCDRVDVGMGTQSLDSTYQLTDGIMNNQGMNSTRRQWEDSMCKEPQSSHWEYDSIFEIINHDFHHRWRASDLPLYCTPFNPDITCANWKIDFNACVS